MGVSAVIPHRNSGELLDRCLDALASADVDEVIVADEKSTDRSTERARRRAGVRVLDSPGKGFGVAVNAGLEAARGKYVLLLNSDAFVRPDTVDRLRRRLEQNPGIAVVGAALVDETGARTKTHHYRLTLRRALLDAVGSRPPLRQEGNGLTLVEAVFPNCTLARTKALAEVGCFDERFYFYYGDMDLCRRLAAAGWRLAVDWDAEAVHIGGGSTSVARPQHWFTQYHKTRVIYLRKHYPRGWVLYSTLWSVKAVLHAVAWTSVAALRRLRSDPGGERRAREWAVAFLKTALPHT